MVAFGVPEMLVAANIDQAIVSLPSIRVNNTFRVHLSSDEAPECSAQTVGDHFGIHPAIGFIDPEHGLLEHPSSPFSGTGSSPKLGQTKITCVHLDHAHKLLPFSILVHLIHRPKVPEIPIESLSVQTQKMRRFCRIDVDAKTGDNFFTR